MNNLSSGLSNSSNQLQPSFNFSHKNNESFRFLGTMAGDQCYIRSIEKGNKATYSRSYNAFGGSDNLRRSFMQQVDASSDAEAFRTIGEEYSYTPFNIRALTQELRNFGLRPGRLSGGGFFLTIKKLEGRSVYWDGFDYALSTFAHQFEQILGVSIDEIQQQCKGYSIDYIIHKYFECVITPEDGDLVVYEKNGKKSHAGIYRSSQPNWNSPSGGTVESKWAYFDYPYIFEHDVFFLPDHLGAVAKFYRLIRTVKEAPLCSSSNIEPLLHEDTANMYDIMEDGTLKFIYTKENCDIRDQLTNTFGLALLKNFPQICIVPHIHFLGLCYHYAFGRILKTYAKPHNVFLESNNAILEKYFTVTKEPKESDLVVYYSGPGIPIHYAIYIGGGIVESKWGFTSEIYRHPIGLVPFNYGTEIKCLKLNDDLTPKKLLELLQNEK